MKKIILLVLLGVLLFSKTNYSPYSWQIIINPKKIKGFELVIWKRLSFKPYIGWSIFTLTGKRINE